MNKYSTIVDGEVLDWIYEKTSVIDGKGRHSYSYKAYIGDIHIGFLYQKKRNNWTVYGSPFKNYSIGVVSGFGTRVDAMEYLVNIYQSHHADAELLIGKNKELLNTIRVVLLATSRSVTKPVGIDPKSFETLSTELTKLLNRN